jgi:hypothetical protein
MKCERSRLNYHGGRERLMDGATDGGQVRRAPDRHLSNRLLAIFTSVSHQRIVSRENIRAEPFSRINS